MAETKGKKKKTYQVSRKGVLVYLVIVFAAMGGMFAMGVVVGRGTSPIRFDIQNIQADLARLKEAVLEKGAEKENGEELSGEDLAEFDIHRHLKEARDDLLFEPQAFTATSGGEAFTPVALPDKLWTIQVAASSDLRDATRMMDKWREMGYPAYVAPPTQSGQTVWHRVRIGRFLNPTEAQKVLASVRRRVGDAFLTRYTPEKRKSP